MLKTWKEPVPGALDTRPVFPPDITRPIENALIKARTSFLEAQQQLQRNQPQMGRGRPMVAPPYRETPTPPGVVRQQMGAPSGYQNYPQPGYPQVNSYATPQPYSVPQQQYQNPQQYPQSYQQPQQYAASQPYPNQVNGHQLPPQPYGLPQVLITLSQTLLQRC